jgi:hypothetical protein
VEPISLTDGEGTGADFCPAQGATSNEYRVYFREFFLLLCPFQERLSAAFLDKKLRQDHLFSLHLEEKCSSDEPQGKWESQPYFSGLRPKWAMLVVSLEPGRAYPSASLLGLFGLQRCFPISC